MKTVEYGRWGECFRLENGQIELLVTRELGPRVIRLGFLEGKNLFREFVEDVGRGKEEEWKLYGGHRLWHAPEESPRTYAPDNRPVKIQVEEQRVIVTQQTEEQTGIQKQMIIRLSSEKNRVTVSHSLINHNLWEVELAVWALSVMNEGGMAVVPQEPFSPHSECLGPVRSMALWAYTDMSDERWRWGKKYVTLKQVPGSPPTKAGFGNRQGWCGYLLDDTAFIKCTTRSGGDMYPDYGSSVELFTNESMLELETLGPSVLLDPGEAIVHVEYWGIFNNLSVTDTDESLDEVLLPLIKEMEGESPCI